LTKDVKFVVEECHSEDFVVTGDRVDKTRTYNGSGTNGEKLKFKNVTNSSYIIFSVVVKDLRLKDEDLKTGPRGSSRTRTFLENTAGLK